MNLFFYNDLYELNLKKEDTMKLPRMTNLFLFLFLFNYYLTSEKINLTIRTVTILVLEILHFFAFPIFIFIYPNCLSILYNYFTSFNFKFHIQFLKYCLILSLSNNMSIYWNSLYYSEYIRYTSYSFNCKLFLEMIKLLKIIYNTEFLRLKFIFLLINKTKTILVMLVADTYVKYTYLKTRIIKIKLSVLILNSHKNFLVDSQKLKLVPKLKKIDSQNLNND